MESAAKKISERIEFQDDRNIVVIDGVKVAGEVLEWFTKTTAEGYWYRVEREGDSVRIWQRHDEVFQSRGIQ